jgi:hypothetical protein
MLVFVCPDCMPAALDSFDGPEDERECICCLQHKVCRSVDVSDAVRTAARVPVKGSVDPSAVTVSIKPAGGAPSVNLPSLGALTFGGKAGQ